MFGKLFLLFTIVPILELALLIRIGGWIGIMPTIGLVVLTAVVGAWLARREGVRAWRRVQTDVASGNMPGPALLNGLAVFVGGALLLTPGILTDVFGLALLAPPTRSLMLRRLQKHLQVAAMRQSGQVEARFWTRDRDEPTGTDSL